MLLADRLTIREVISTIRGMNENSCTLKGYFRVHFNEKNMKTSFLTLAAAALLLAGCSKEELTENVLEGTSSVATQTNARFGNPDATPEVWFNQNNGTMFMRVPPRWTHVAISASVRTLRAPGSVNDDVLNDSSDDYEVIEAPLTRIGNSRIYRSGQNQFVFGQTSYFSLVDVTLTANTFIDDWQGESTYLKLFLYPSGRTVEQDPKVARIRTRSVTNSDSAHEMVVIVADDPTQDVASVVFRSELPADPNDPTSERTVETVALGQTHFNQALGLSRWVGQLGCQGFYNPQTGEWVCEDDCPFDDVEARPRVMLKSSTSYNVDFLSEEENKTIVAVYGGGGCDDENDINLEPSDEPEILGSRLGSTSFGEQWQLEIAIADVGDWVKKVNYVFEPGEGPAPLVAELPMQLTRTEGNLRVYTSPKFSFNGNPTGNNVGGIVYLFGTGTRSTAGTAKQKAELL